MCKTTVANSFIVSINMNHTHKHNTIKHFQLCIIHHITSSLIKIYKKTKFQKAEKGLQLKHTGAQEP